MGDSTTVVRISDVSKRFVIRKEKTLKERIVNFGRSNKFKDDFWALRDINLDIQSGSTVGLIGPNGSGKSTLLKLIGGIIRPTSGSVQRRGRLAALIELGAGFHPDLTGRENVYLNCAILGLSRQQTDQHFDSIADFARIDQFIDTQVKFYSSGMYIRLAFAVAVHVDPDVLLVDEVLAVGDEPFQRKCMDRIRSFQNDGRTIIIVSHGLDQIVELCDRAVVLEHGQIQIDDTPLLAMRQLRADFEVTRTEDREREREAVTVQRAARAHVVGVSFADSGQSSKHMVPGEDVTLHIDLNAEEQLNGWLLGVSIDSSMGQVVFGTNTKLLGVGMPSFRGRRRFTITLSDLQLGEGIYSIHAAIAEGSGVEIDRLRDAASITVEADGQSVGFLHSRAQISLD
jgi:ABC-2 type transport system ATP-binding protein